MALSDLEAASETVVHGSVISLEPYWDEGRRSIYTTVVIEPIGYMKGDLGSDPIVFDMPGGAVGELRLVVSDMPDFELGEEVILFLKDEDFRIVGFFQGKFTVRNGIVVEEGISVESFGRRVAALALGMSLEPEFVPGEPWETGEAQEEKIAAKKNREILAQTDVKTGTQTDGKPMIRPAQFRIEHPDAKVDEAEIGHDATDLGSSPRDAAKALNSRDVEVLGTDIVRSPAGTVTIMSEGFEGTWPSAGWDLIDQAGTGHLWGKDDYNPLSGTYSMWEASAGVNALDPEFNNHPHNMGTWARYGPFDLSDATSAQLFFWHSVNTAEVDDHLYWASSGDGSNFDGYIASGGIGFWWPQILDLSAHLGDSSVWIAFLFESDATLNDKGAFVDDIVLTKDVVLENPPVVTGITPDTGPSGAGLSVTISGTYFGDTQGSSEVRFTKDPLGGTFANADVVTSWTDTVVVCEVPEYASSGLVNIVVQGDPGTGLDFNVTFGAGAHTWPYAEPMWEDLVINPNTADVTDELPAVIHALQEWNAGGGGAFSFTYGGATSATAYSFNNTNEVCWGSTGGAVAASYTWIEGTEVLESDLVFDDLWTWSTSTPPGGVAFDVQAVATHEFGHWLRLVDLYGTADEGKTMYGRISFGEYHQRTLETADKNGIQFQYGQETVNITSRLLPVAEIGTPYSEALVASGGATPYSWALRLLTLPPGLSVRADGVISGIPTTAGTYYFNVRVTDNNLDKDSQIFYMPVSEDVAGPAVTVLAPNAGDSLEVGSGYDITWTAIDGGGVDSVSIYYSIHGGSGYQLIASGEANDGVYAWVVPASPTDSLVVKVIAYDPSLRTGQDESDSLSAIHEPTVDVPGQGQRFSETVLLMQNSPNPFSPSTNISFYLPEDQVVRLEVFDASGRLADTIIAGHMYPAGLHAVSWNGRNRDGTPLGAGVYFYRLKAGSYSLTKKMALAR
jgi:hypothetical protein